MAYGGRSYSGRIAFLSGAVGEELITDKFPEFSVFKDLLPSGTVLDGEIICIEKHEDSWKPLPFALLQTRIGRKNVTRKHLKESPAGFIAYDLLELEGIDYNFNGSVVTIRVQN